MNEKKVTIIVGIYNSDKYLEKGLESIRNQTWSNIEVLLMDDGSTDRSGEICDTFQKLDYRFRAIHKDNTGVCDSRNIGLKMATGDYVCFMDGDDWLSIDFVEYMMNLVNETGCHMVFSDKLFTTQDQMQINYDEIKVIGSEEVILKIIYMDMVLGPWNKLYSMQIIRENNIQFPEHWFGETLHFASLVAYYAKNIAFGHRKVYNYRLNNPTSGTSVYKVENKLLSLDNVLSLKNEVFYNSVRIKNAVSWHIYDNYFLLILDIIGSGNKASYQSEYNYAKKYLKKNCLNVFLKSEIDVKRKIVVLCEALTPNLFARQRIYKRLWKIKNHL